MLPRSEDEPEEKRQICSCSLSLTLSLFGSGNIRDVRRLLLYEGKKRFSTELLLPFISRLLRALRVCPARAHICTTHARSCAHACVPPCVGLDAPLIRDCFGSCGGSIGLLLATGCQTSLSLPVCACLWTCNDGSSSSVGNSTGSDAIISP